MSLRTMTTWTQEELALVRAQLEADKDVFEIADALERTPYAVVGKLMQLGRLVQNGTYDYFRVSQEPWAYGQELHDHQTFKRDKSPPARNMLVWKAEELAQAAELMREGKTIFQIAEVLQRTPYAVIGRLPGLVRMADMNYYVIDVRPWALAEELKKARDGQTAKKNPRQNTTHTVTHSKAMSTQTETSTAATVPTVSTVSTKTIEVPLDALGKVLRALVGPPHYIRELQATMNLPTRVAGENPINTLIELYNQAASRTQASPASEPEKSH